MRRYYLPNLPAFLAVATCLLLGSALAPAQDKPVRTETIRIQSQIASIDTSGLLQNQSEQTLAFKTPGIVSQVLVKAGQHVNQGDLLAILDTEEADAQLAQAEAVHADALRNQKRLRKLHQRNVIALEQLQGADTAVEVAASQLRLARFNARHARIEAPATGRVLVRYIEPNEQVSAQRPAFEFAEDNAGWVIRLGLNDRDVVRVQVGDRADIRLDAYPGLMFTGQVDEVAAKASQTQGTFAVNIKLQDTSVRLLSGMVARVQVHPSEPEQVVKVPLSALIAAKGSQAEVFVVGQDDRVQQRSVTLRGFDNSHALISQGLATGEQVVTHGATGLADGRVIEAYPGLEN